MTAEVLDGTYTVVLHNDGPDGLWAEVEEFPGLFASGFTMAELWESLEEGLALYTDAAPAAESRPMKPVEGRVRVRLTG